MKSRLLFIFLLVTCSLSAQSYGRMTIKGQINVPPGDDLDGIVVYNMNTLKGTITDGNGVFYLSVGLNDEMLVQSVQFEPLKVKVNLGMIRTKKITVNLKESVNQLDTVAVSSSELTGSIAADVKRVPVIDGAPQINFATVRLEESIYDDATPVENVALDEDTYKYGLNFVNIYKMLVNKRSIDKKGFKISAEDELAQMYGNSFFKNTLDIKPENVGPFMDYVAANGLNKEMLDKGNELNLIQFLIAKREGFKTEMAKN